MISKRAFTLEIKYAILFLQQETKTKFIKGEFIMARPKMTEKAESVKARMTVEEKVAELDRKIQGHEQNIETLKAKKERLLNPPTRTRRKGSVSSVLKKAKEMGMSAEEIALKLGIDFEH